MPFTADTAAEAGSRSSRKGSKNKNNFFGAEIKGKLGEFTNHILDDILKEYSKLTLPEKVAILPKIAPYLVPKKSERQLNLTNLIDLMSEEDVQEVTDLILSKIENEDE